MERRVLLAVLLSFLVLYAVQALFPSPPDTAKKTEQASKVATAPNASAPAQSNPTPSTQPAEAAPDAAAQAPESDVVVDNPGVHAVFTTRGAVVKSWQLKRFRDAQDQPYEMLAGHMPPGSPLPFTLGADDPALEARLATAPFKVSAQTGADGAWKAQFDYDDGAGLHAQKIFSIAPDRPYLVIVTASLTRNGQPLPVILKWGPALGSGITVKSRVYNPPPQPIFSRDRSVTRMSVDKIPAQPVQEGKFDFAGVDDHYFITAVVRPQDPIRLDFAPVSVQLDDHPDGAHYVSWTARYPSGANSLSYFVGPKSFDALRAVDPEFINAIHFGTFQWLVVPLLQSLKWVYGYVGNYGWSLIILTIVINLVMFPLRHKSVVSMRKMQEVQPEVKAIQDRYAHLKMSDPGRAKMNQEMMALYKERGVNPASGCVPMLLTLPVLYAFYSVLSVAIELRGAPFFGQIHDLTAHDPWFIWPIAMGVTMFIQQKMTPTTADPTQQRMMLIMPVMMSGMFLWASAGLVIYWTVSNVWGIAQQLITNRIIGPAPQRLPPRPPAERRVKTVGGGKTLQASKERPS